MSERRGHPNSLPPYQLLFPPPEKPSKISLFASHPVIVAVVAAFAGAVAHYYFSPDSTYALKLTNARLEQSNARISELEKELKQANDDRIASLLARNDARRDNSDLTRMNKNLSDDRERLTSENNDLVKKAVYLQATADNFAELQSLDRYVSENFTLTLGALLKVEDGHSAMTLKSIAGDRANLKILGANDLSVEVGDEYEIRDYNGNASFKCGFEIKEITKTAVKLASTCRYSNW